VRARKKETERESAIHTHTHTSTCSGCIVILFRYYSTDEASVAVVVIGSNILPVPHSHFGSSPFPFFFYYYFLVVFFSFSTVLFIAHRSAARCLPFGSLDASPQASLGERDSDSHFHFDNDSHAPRCTLSHRSSWWPANSACLPTLRLQNEIPFHWCRTKTQIKSTSINLKKVTNKIQKKKINNKKTKHTNRPVNFLIARNNKKKLHLITNRLRLKRLNWH